LFWASRNRRQSGLLMARVVVSIEFEADDAKAHNIADRLFDQFYDQKGFFQGYTMPEYLLPTGMIKGSREHALYLTYVISIDYMTDARKLWSNARGAFSFYPERFQPSTILDLADRTLTSFLRNLGARYPKSALATWKKISTLLNEKYEGDPRNITNTPLTIDEIRNRIDEFPYLRGDKLFNFYLRAMGENGLLKISNFNELDIPVDAQVARFTFYTGAVKIKGQSFQGCVYEDPLRGIIQAVWRRAANELNIYQWKLDEPIWTIGSSLCAKWKCGRCPVEELCEKVKGYRIIGGNLTWKRSS